MSRLDTASDIATIVTIDLETGEESVVFQKSNRLIHSLSWSPDGQKLVFDMRERIGKSHGIDTRAIHILNVSTNSATQISGVGDGRQPVWSPDADIIAYVEWVPRGQSILHLVKPDGSCDIEVPGLRGVWSPSWSPKGDRIAFISDGGVYMVDLKKSLGAISHKVDYPVLSNTQ